MKKFLFPLLVLAVLLVSLSAAAFAEGENITVEISNEAKLPLYAADDPYVSMLRHGAQQEDSLPVLVVPVKKSVQLQTAVKPVSLMNKRVQLTVDRPDLVKIQGKSLNGLIPGETILTAASEENPAAKVQYRILVIQYATRLMVTAEEKTVPVGGKLTLSASYVPEDTTLQSVIWSSGDERIATVDENGMVTGIKRGSVRISAVERDGSKVKASLNIQVVQMAEEIQLNDAAHLVDVGRSTVLKATVLPKDTNDKNVVWSSSDEGIARVNQQGRVTGIALGECEIICCSKENGRIQARATVHVQQPVKSFTFGEVPKIYTGESGQLTWTVEPSNASNPALKLTSSNEKILLVSENGTITGISGGEAYVNAVTTDGSNRRARIKVKVYQHVTGVRMRRSVAYIDIGQTNTTGAVLEPKTATNHMMTWTIGDSSIASVTPLKKEPNRVKITGHQQGTTTLTGVTEDGGFQTSMTVKIGNYDRSLSLRDAYVKNKSVFIIAKNQSDLDITSITAEVSFMDTEGNPIPVNSKDGSNTFQMVYQKTLRPGRSTAEDDWKYVDYKPTDSPAVTTFEIRITQFQINNDWNKTIQKKHQPTKVYHVHL